MNMDKILESDDQQNSTAAYPVDSARYQSSYKSEYLEGCVPIALEAIQSDTSLGCDLYLQNMVNGDSHYVLYCNRSGMIKSDNIRELLKRNVKNLYIFKDDQKTYLRYVELSLKSIINIDCISMEQKAQMVYDVAKNIMTDIFRNPRSGKQIERSEVWVSNAAEFIIKNTIGFKNIMEVISRDYHTCTHSVNVAMLGLLFAKYLGFESDDMHSFGTGLLLHDIGKILIGQEIMNKTEKLNNEEFEKIKRHVELGVNILIQNGGSANVTYLTIIQHHEKCNGKGYPGGLKGNEIHKYGKISSIIDVYDALTTKRPYSGIKKPFAALKVMMDEMEGSFDKKFLRDFVLFLGAR